MLTTLDCNSFWKEAAMMKTHRVWFFASVLLGSTFGPPGDLLAQDPPPIVGSQRDVYLMQQPSTSCNNSDVKLGDWSNQRGILSVLREKGNLTRVTIAMTAKPNTTYQFFLKCGPLLGTIKTEEEGEAGASFEFPTSAVSDIYGFEMYATGAKPGDKFESTPVNFH
jgi:hypothetical protein